MFYFFVIIVYRIRSYDYCVIFMLLILPSIDEIFAALPNGFELFAVPSTAAKLAFFCSFCVIVCICLCDYYFRLCHFYNK